MNETIAQVFNLSQRAYVYTLMRLCAVINNIIIIIMQSSSMKNIGKIVEKKQLAVRLTTNIKIFGEFFFF